VGGGRDVTHVGLTDRGHRVEHGVELAGEEVELLLGHGQPGQAREVRDLLPCERVLPGERAHWGANSNSAVLDGSGFRPHWDPATLRGPSGGR